MSTPNSSRLIREARKLVSSGFAVFPLEPAQKGKAGSGKRPITSHGVKDATKRLKELRLLISGRENHGLNLAVATGRKSGLLIIDQDPRNGGDKELKRLCKRLGKLPRAPLVETGGGGTHRYFKLPNELTLSKTILGLGIDVLADNAYAVAPPSRHASGNVYRWREKRSLDDLNPPELPPAWIAAISQRVSKAGQPKSVTLAAKANEAAAHAIAEGQRNVTLTRLAGSLKARGLDRTQIEAGLQRANATQCTPPLDSAEVSRIASSAARWTAPDSTAGDAELISDKLLKDHFQAGELIRYERGGEFFVFTGTHWQPRADDELKQLIFTAIREHFPQARKRLNAVANEVLAVLRTETRVRDEDDLLHFASDPPPVVNVLNGEIWLGADGSPELRPHSPNTGCRHVLPVCYDADATCPRYDKAVAEIFSRAKDPDRLAAVWDEIGGYAIQPSRQGAMITMFVGGGGNGKSKLVETLQKLLGSDAVYAGEIGRLETSPFGIGSLVGKLLFVDDDVSSRTKLPDGILKKLSEAKLVTGERKHKDSFNFVNRAVPMLLCNNIPALADVSPGIQRQLTVLRFDRTFAPEEQDPHLFPTIWRTELPGVLNRFIRGFGRFVQNGHRLSDSKDLERGRRDLLVQANPLATFVKEACIKDEEGRIGLSELYRSFGGWIRENGYRSSLVRNHLKRDMGHLGFRTVTVKGNATVVGLSLRSE